MRDSHGNTRTNVTGRDSELDVSPSWGMISQPQETLTQISPLLEVQKV
ncbi:MAG: hypothetical protein AB8B70_10240 [Prochlorococcus sp.]